MEDKEFMPECCRNCTIDKNSLRCQNAHTHCPEWRTWFRKEWSRIRRAAMNLAENKNSHGKIRIYLVKKEDR